MPESIIFACYSHDFVRPDGEIIENYGFDILCVPPNELGPFSVTHVKIVGGRGEISDIEDLAQYLWNRRITLEERGKDVLGFGTAVTPIAVQIANNPRKL